ncbi:MAG: hypothetical protein ACI4AE_01255 [Candidatus Cryptobacteroides sp.]
MRFDFKMMMLASLASVSLLASCGKDDSGKGGNEENDVQWITDNFLNVAYNDESGLVLSYSDAIDLGKVVTVTACDDETLTLTLEGASVEDFGLGAIATPGVFPGEKKSTLSVGYTRVGDVLEIGTQVKEGAYAFTLTGTLAKGSYVIDINDVTVAANAAFAGMKLNLVNYVDGEGSVDANTPVEEVDALYPFHLVWNPSDAAINIDLGFGVPIPMQVVNILRMVMVMPIIEIDEQNSISVMEALQGVLRSVSFRADGNVVAEFSDMENPGVFAESPLNLVQYKLLNDHQVAVYFNPSVIEAAASAASVKSEEDVMNKVIAALAGIVANYAPMLADGVVLEYAVYDNGVISVYLGGEFFAPLLSAAAQLLGDEEIMALLTEMIASDESMADMAGLIGGILPQLPGLLGNCEGLEVGLNFTPAL